MSRINVVLHRPIYSRNVGMCARALANMGGSRLILIEPQNELTVEAKQGAAHAQEILSQARVYRTREDFYQIEGEGLRIALSGRAGVKDPETLDTVVGRMKADRQHMFHSPDIPIYLLFGPEDNGLSNDEMMLAHHICRLPTFGEITSLNLSHAVLLASYLVMSHLAPSDAAPELHPVHYPDAAIHDWLESLGFDLSAPKVNIEKTLNRILLSHCPTPDELRILKNVLNQTLRRIRK